MKPEQIKQVASRIADEIFRDVWGNAADRLAMKYKKIAGGGESEGGGWCKKAIRDLIVRELSKSPENI